MGFAFNIAQVRYVAQNGYFVGAGHFGQGIQGGSGGFGTGIEGVIYNQAAVLAGQRIHAARHARQMGYRFQGCREGNVKNQAGGDSGQHRINLVPAQ